MKCDHKPGILKTAHNGIPVVRLLFGPYEADICPAIGANCIRFASGGLNVLRTPPGLDAFYTQPNVYGMPLLFPPNRIQNGVFLFQGRVYRFPVNEPARGHHIHGILSSTPFLAADTCIQADGVCASFAVSFDDHTPYLSFPHAFHVRLGYRLDHSGLTQTITLANLSTQSMPAGLGFHTAFQVPFVPYTAQEEYRLTAQVGEEICLDSTTIIPTGETLKASVIGQALCEGALIPTKGPFSHHFGRRTGEITLSHVPTSAAVHYLPDPFFSFLMLWNGGGQSGFICPEPQTWQVDAPNSPLPPEKSGFFTLEPYETLHLTNKLCIDSGTEETGFCS